MKTALIAVLVGAVCGYFLDGVQVVPLPREMATGTSARKVSAGGLALTLDAEEAVCGAECAAIVKAAFERTLSAGLAAQTPFSRWKLSIHPEFDVAPPAAPTAGLAELANVRVVFDGSAADTLPEPGYWSLDDEYYRLVVPEKGDVTVTVKTAWGTLRAFETLLQLCEWDHETAAFSVARLPLDISDYPRFRWRGLWIDAVRHWLPMSMLKQFIDAMSALKLNYLTLQLADAQSFPLEIKEYPQLKNSWFTPKTGYTQEEMADFIAYARERGIAVNPFLDMPGHAASWRNIGDSVVATCFQYLADLHKNYMENIVALNPANPKSFEAIDTITREMAALFKTPILHIGGDEVDYRCWNNSDERDAILAYMQKNNIADFRALEGVLDLYMQEQTFAVNRRPMVSEEVFDFGFLANKDVVIHGWKTKEVLEKAVKAGYDIVQSWGYYLDRQDPVCNDVDCPTYWMWSWTHRTFYSQDLTAGLNLTEEEKSHVLGGLACSFEESVDDQNLNDRALSRLQSFAERMWSSEDVVDAQSIELRSMRQRCLMVRRGISRAGPLSSDYCETLDNQQ